MALALVVLAAAMHVPRRGVYAPEGVRLYRARS